MAELGKLLTLNIVISVLGFSLIMIALIYMAKLLGEARASTERISTSMERIVTIIDRDLQEIKDLLRGQSARRRPAQLEVKHGERERPWTPTDYPTASPCWNAWPRNN